MKKEHKILSVLNGKISPSTKQFLLTLLATTISIVLTFGTSAVIDRHQKRAAKKEMVMMIVYDFDKTIEFMMKADTVFQEASKAQQEIALHPEFFDSLSPRIMPAITLTSAEFSETTEKIFSSNIETFSTIGNVNFVHEVSYFYNTRHSYKDAVLDVLRDEISGAYVSQLTDKFFNISFPQHYYANKFYKMGLQKTRNRCMQMMKISEEDLEEFSRQRTIDESDEFNIDRLQMLNELYEAEEIITQAREKLAGEELETEN